MVFFLEYKMTGVVAIVPGSCFRVITNIEEKHCFLQKHPPEVFYGEKKF